MIVYELRVASNRVDHSEFYGLYATLELAQRDASADAGEDLTWERINWVCGWFARSRVHGLGDESFYHYYISEREVEGAEDRGDEGRGDSPEG